MEDEKIEIVVEAEDTNAATDTEKATKALIFSIISVVLADSCCLSIVGLVFSIISMNMAKKAPVCTKQKVAKILSIVALALSIVAIICFVISCVTGGLAGIFAYIKGNGGNIVI